VIPSGAVFTEELEPSAGFMPDTYAYKQLLEKRSWQELQIIDVVCLPETAPMVTTPIVMAVILLVTPVTTDLLSGNRLSFDIRWAK
jgi:hypothetical protein